MKLSAKLFGIVAAACLSLGAVAQADTVTLSNLSVTYNSVTGDTYSYRIQANWTTSGLFCTDMSDIYMEFYDSSGNLKWTQALILTPSPNNRTTSPVDVTQTFNNNGAATVHSTYNNLNPKVKATISYGVYHYRAYAWLDDGLGHQTQNQMADITPVSAHVTLP